MRFVITDREAFDSLRLGLEIAFAMEKLYPGKMDYEVNRRLIGNRALIEAMKKGEDPRNDVRLTEDALREFVASRKAFLIYN